MSAVPQTPFARALSCYRIVDVKGAIRRASNATYRDLANWTSVYSYGEVLDDSARQTILADLEAGRLARLAENWTTPRDQHEGPPRGRRSRTGTRSRRVTEQGTTVRIGRDVAEHGEPVASTSSAPATQRRIASAASDDVEDSTVQDAPDESEYLKCVDEDTIKARVVEFIERTGNTAMSQGVCVSCHRLLLTEELEDMAVEAIPNAHLLKPVTPHQAHQLSADGLLLARGPYTAESVVSLCSLCLGRLKVAKRPRLSLANNLWIGDIPLVLQRLTLPERILISLYFPCAYIVKLYPGGRRTVNWNQPKIQNGLKGNVSTYKLDQQLIAGMVGLTMLPPVRILSATIAITYVGPTNMKKAWLPGTFRVRRSQVQAALLWLKANNPLYKHITVSEDRLHELPLNAVPDELMDTMAWNDDTHSLDEEHSTYVPLNDAAMDEDGALSITFLDILSDASSLHLAQLDALLEPDAMDVDTGSPGEDEDTEGNPDAEPDVISMQCLGVVDIAGNDIPNDELFSHALVNSTSLERAGGKPDYLVRHGSAFINEYARRDPATGLRYDGGHDNPNHILGTFPFLFPYGVGGFETNQEESVSYEVHARWALQYSDRRFRMDPLFMFQVFGVMQKREVCRAAVLQVSIASESVQKQLKSLTQSDLLEAAEQEARKRPISNPAVRALRSQMTAIRARVTGTDESRHSVRGKIWGTTLMYNSPSLWITINPSDTQDPIAQVLMGEEIDLDKFCDTAGPSQEQRTLNVAADPFGAAQFFHLIIKIILESLFGIKANSSGHRIHRQDGLFGTVQAYIGTVEAQGRGTLHLHLLVWLKGTPGFNRYKEMLRQESFIEKIRAFIRQNIWADVNNHTTKELLNQKPVPYPAYSRPLDPREADYDTAKARQLKKLARATQFHECKPTRCLIPKKGRVVCKRGAPWALSIDAWVSEAGHWGPKRISGLLNNFNPTILTTMRCNHDIKLITQGSATRNITWYITNYASKKQQHSSNASALLAKKFAFHAREEKKNPNATDRNKRLLQRCANTLTRDREFSAPEVVSYIMGWGDRYESHYYVNIRWDMAFRALINSYPHLKDESERGRQKESFAEGQHDSGAAETSTVPESFTVQFLHGSLELRSQLKEYAHRGEELEQDCFLKVMLDTYDAPYSPESGPTHVDPASGSGPRARPRHDRIKYLDSYGNATRCRVRRARTHETLPRIIGRWFPRADDADTRELYCASILMLLSPWRSLQDLLRNSDSFEKAYLIFSSAMGSWEATIIENIQFYYECADGAREDATQEANSMSYAAPLEEDLRQQLGVELPTVIDPAEGLTEQDVENARRFQYQERERVHLDLQLLIARNAGLNVPNDTLFAMAPLAQRMNGDMFDVVAQWERALKQITRKAMPIARPADAEEASVLTPSALSQPITTVVQASVEEVVNIGGDQRSGALRQTLNEEQVRAHDIIVNCMLNEMNGVPQDQLLMVVHGQGGTGKTHLIKAITQTLTLNDAAQYLGKTATSGIAASPIGGTTVHAYFGIPIQPKGRDWVSKANDEIQERRVKNIAQKHMVFIDEMSMLTKANLANISEVAQIVRAQNGVSNSTLPFGGLHIVLFGDLHQFPPVAAANHALYHEVAATVTEANERAAFGRQIFKQFNVVVFLKKQKRSRDPRWTELLDRARVGECTEEDIDEVNKLALTDERCVIPDFESREWEDVILVTTRHSLRVEWNTLALRKHCREAGHCRYIIQASDTDIATGKSPRIDFRVAAAAKNWKETGKLADRIEIAKGMKIMVSTNIATEADIANGTRGVIEDFWLDPDEEPQVQADGAYVLSHLPPVIFFKPNEIATAEFDGVPKGLIPITPSSATFTVLNSADQPCRIRRRQYAITGAYAFTDYKSQGQTIEKVIIDLSKPPVGKAPDAFSAYVALSRGTGRDSIRLLTPLNASLLTTHPSEALREEMTRLTLLDGATTRNWEDHSPILM